MIEGKVGFVGTSGRRSNIVTCAPEIVIVLVSPVASFRRVASLAVDVSDSVS